MIRFVPTLLLLAVAAGAGAQPPSLDEARRLLREGNLDAAMAAVEARLSQDAGDRQSRFLKGVVLAERQQGDAAIEVFKALSKDFPDLPEPYNNLAVLYAARGDYESARDALLSAINTHPSYATAHENLGDIYAKMAGQAYSRALSLDVDNPAAKKKLSLIDDLFTRGATLPPAPTMVAARTDAPAAARPVAPVPRPVAEPAPVRSARVPAPVVAAPARTPAPAASAAPAAAAAIAAPARSGSDEQGSAIEAIQAWAAAWSAQDVERYLSHYAAGISPEEGVSRERWEASRRERVARPSSIKVDVDNFQVRSAGPERLDVTLVQRYRSDSYSDRVRKRLGLERQSGTWKITSERTIAKL